MAWSMRYTPWRSVPAAVQIAEKIAANSPTAVQAVKRAVQMGEGQPIEQAIAIMMEAHWRSAVHPDGSKELAPLTRLAIRFFKILTTERSLRENNTWQLQMIWRRHAQRLRWFRPNRSTPKHPLTHLRLPLPNQPPLCAQQLGSPHDGRLEVNGAVEHPLTLTLDALRSMPTVTRVVTLECAGNGRLGQTPLPVGEPWGSYAVSALRWSGARLSEGPGASASSRWRYRRSIRGRRPARNTTTKTSRVSERSRWRMLVIPRQNFWSHTR